MRLYTVCTHGRPVLVISTNVEPPMEDIFTTDPELMKAHRLTRSALTADDEVQRVIEQHEIDEALDTWLGEDLVNLKHDGRSLWNGDPSQLVVREATTDEATKWDISRRSAIDAGEEDAGNEDWVAFLIPVSA